jgi:hypothetical protein
MLVGRTVFAQVMEHFPAYEFQKCVTRYAGDFGKRSFSCLDQFLCLGFAQLTYRESLRDIEARLRSAGRITWASRPHLAPTSRTPTVCRLRIYDFAQVLIDRTDGRRSSRFIRHCLCA